MAVIMSKQIVLPVKSKLLSDYAEGDIVKLNENGTPVEFYVAKHDYESGLNGAGRTLLVRKECHSKQQWHSENTNEYSTSYINTWLNGTYKGLLDAKVQNAIGETKFYYTPGNLEKTMTTLSRGVFLLSLYELGIGEVSYYTINKEGSTLPIASSLKIAYLNGTKETQWCRTVFLLNTGFASALNTSGQATNPRQTDSGGVRPCFTLSGNCLFDPDTNEFKGVA